jgi:hypothetical protein
VHSYVGTDQPAAPNQYVVGMATDFMSKWGGVPFSTSATITALTEPGCTTGDTLCWCMLYCQQVKRLLASSLRVISLGVSSEAVGGRWSTIPKEFPLREGLGSACTGR